MRDLDKQREWRERNKERTVAARRALRERAKTKMAIEETAKIVIKIIDDQDALVAEFIAKHGVRRCPPAALVPTTADIKPDGVIADYHDARNAEGHHLLKNVMNRIARVRYANRR